MASRFLAVSSGLRVSRAIIVAAVIAGAGCNSILGIEQGHIVDGGQPGQTATSAGGAANASPADAGCTTIAGDYAESDTPGQSDCTPPPVAGSHDVTVAIDGATATATIDGMVTCSGTVAGCVVSCSYTNSDTGASLSAQLTFDASGFSGQLTDVLASGCTESYDSTGVRQ
jgi:hypothetical protein